MIVTFCITQIIALNLIFTLNALVNSIDNHSENKNHHIKNLNSIICSASRTIGNALFCVYSAFTYWRHTHFQLDFIIAFISSLILLSIGVLIERCIQ